MTQATVSGPLAVDFLLYFKRAVQTEGEKMQNTSLNKTEPPGSDEWSTAGLGDMMTWSQAW